MLLLDILYVLHERCDRSLRALVNTVCPANGAAQTAAKVNGIVVVGG